MPEDDVKELKKSRRKNKRLVLSGATLLILIIVGAGGWFYAHRDSSPIPESIRRSVGFALYYPSPPPIGYSFQKDSVKTANDVVFYTLQSGSQTITVSQQPAPSTPPDLDALQKSNTSFKSVDTDAGQAIIGTNPQGNSVTAILVTNTTLVNINGSKNVPRDVIAKTAKNMSSLAQ